MDPVELFSLARLRAAIAWPPLAPAIWALRQPHPVPGLLRECGGAVATDTHWRVYYDPEAIVPFTVSQAATALVHEAWHCLRLHGDRASVLHVEPQWYAALAAALDAEVNGDMARCSPPPAWPYAVFTPKDLDMPVGLPFEAYYPEAQRVVGPKEPRLLGGSSMGGAPRPWEHPLDGSGVDRLEAAHVCRAVARAVKNSSYGFGGGFALRWAEELLAPSRVPWQQLLAQALRGSLSFAAGAVDYTRQAPNRKQAVTPVLLPVLRRPVATVDVQIDTSGSMGEVELQEALTETKGVIKAAGAAVRLFAVDAVVQGEARRVQSVSSVELRGGGGTDMGVGIAFAERQKPKADVLVVLTDAFSPWPAERPKIPRVVVALIGKYHAAPSTVPSWARVVEVEVAS